MNDPAPSGDGKPPPRPSLDALRPTDTDRAASQLGIGLAWMGGIALVGSLAFLTMAVLGPLVIPPLCVLVYVLIHYFLWGRWLGPRLRKIAEEQEQSDQ